MSIIGFILILAILVLIHEFGHFIAAKKAGVLVEEFGFGFPPRIFSFKYGETLYSINLFPIGGFVKVFGEEYDEVKSKDLPADLRKRTFVSKKPWQKAIIVVAGIFMNILLGAGIYYFLLGTHNFASEPLPLFQEYKFAFATQENKVIVSYLPEGSRAKEAGVVPGDIITRLNVENGEWVPVKTMNQLIALVNDAQGKHVSIEVKNVRDDITKMVNVIPMYNQDLKRAVIGIGLAEVAILHYDSPLQKAFSGFAHSYNIVVYNIDSIGYLVKSSFKAKSVAPVAQTVAGPIGIFGIVDDIFKTSGPKLATNLLNLLAILSLSLASINVLPFPALDGGRLVFVIWEWITKKPVNEKFERYLNFAGFALLIALSAAIFINDILKLTH